MEINLNRLEKEMLELLFKLDRGISSTEFRSEIGGLEGYKLNYRYEKLEEAGLIKLRDKEESDQTIPPKIAELTEKGREEIRRGLIGEDVFGESSDTIELPKSYVQNLRTDVEELEGRVNSLLERKRQSDQKVERLEETLRACVLALNDKGVRVSPYMDGDGGDAPDAR